MSQTSQTRIARWLLPAIVLIYSVLGLLYALETPPWQAPDEPAHYNYVRYLAEQNRFPVLKPGDYPAAYLEEIKAAKFPPEMSIAPIRYEFHQPPLYYLLAVPVYGVGGGALLPLRLLSLVLGALLLLVVNWAVLALAPGRPLLALGATAFVAFLPMHLAMTAAANNDLLSELLVAIVLLLIIRYLKDAAAPEEEGKRWQFLVLLGVTTGLGLVTKSSAYIALPLVLVAILARDLWLEQEPPPLTRTLKAAGIYLLPSIALAMPWWLRNIALYGGQDFLGLVRHDQVVIGQLRTADFISQHGLSRLVQDFVTTTFRSYWGQFGWMGVLLDARLYQIMAMLSLLALVGFLLWAVRAWRRRTSYAAWQWAGGGLLALAGLLTLAAYLWYNTGFLQHQGRYLFLALLPAGLAVALGWREVLRRERALPLAVFLVVCGIALLLAGILGPWGGVILILTGISFGIRYFLPRAWDRVVFAVPYILLILLDLVSLFFFIVPQLRV